MIRFQWHPVGDGCNARSERCRVGRGILAAGGLLFSLLMGTWLPLRAADEALDIGEDENTIKQYLEWLTEGRLADKGGPGSLLQAWKEAENMPNNNAGAFWEPIGPASMLFSGITRVSGRTNTIAIDPRDPNVIYLGAALGGVWKTTDGGQSWTALTDDQPSLAMGALAIDPVNPDIIYAGTGEQNFAQDTYYGLGVLRSTDAGATWTRLGEEVFVDPNGGGTFISRVVVDPDAPETVYVASTYGLYKSTDRGQTWALKLSSRSQATVTDLVMDPSDSATLYAGLGVQALASNKGIYKSTDRGETWVKLDLDPGVAAIGRINLAITPSDPQTIYASISRTSGTPQMYRLKSTDGGQSWQRLTDCNANCNQGLFNNVLAVHPKNPDVVYHGAVNLFRSTDGGLTWAGTTRVHTDHHALVFDALGNLYIGSDGGIFRINPDDTTSNLNSNLNITQFYAGVALHPSNRDSMFAGSQDNGSARFRGDPAAWARTCTGDGMFQAIEGADGDPDNIWYCAAQNLLIRKTLDDGRSFRGATNGIDRRDAAFIAPYVVDPNNSQVLIAGTRAVWRTEDGAENWVVNGDPLSPSAIRSLAFAPLDSATTYYAGSTGFLWRTTDTGNSWTRVSEGLPAGRVVTQIRVSPLDSNTVYATFSGFGTGHVFRTTDAGMSWTDVSGNLPNIPATALLIDVTTGPTPVLYVGTDIGVFRSPDDGLQWERFSTGLPNVRVEDLVYNPTTGVFVASTHGRGMWRLNFGS